MAQHDYVIANGTGAAVRSDLNGSLAAIVSNNSGATEPGTMYAYQWWADTTTGLLKLRNSANSAWISLRELDGTLTIEDGTAAAPGLAFTSDLNTGLFRVGADQLAITTGGTSRLAVSTTAVSSTLAVDVPLGAVGTPSLTFTGDLNTGIYSPGADQVAITTGGTQRLNADTAAITSTLPVVHPLGAVGTPSITFTGDLNTGIWSPAADTIAFSEGGAEAMRIDSSGRLLVGTSSARDNFFNTTGTARLVQVEHVGTGTGGISVVRNSNADGGSSLVLAASAGTALGSNTLVSSTQDLGQISFQGADGTEFVAGASITATVDGTPGANDLPTRLVFSTTADGAASPTERMRIASDGTSTFTGLGTVVANFTNSTNASTYSAIITTIQANGNNTSTYHFRGNTASVGNWYLFGNGTTSYSSDERLKKNIETTRDGYLDDIRNLRVVKYNWKNHEDGTPKELGLIAQEVEQVFPNLVQDDLAPVSDEDPTLYKQLKGSVFPMILLKALQEAAEKIETQGASIAALEARLSALESA
jgi:hypothetical protein